MKKIIFNYWLLIPFLIIFVILSETAWIMHVYQIEKQNFNTITNQAIQKTIIDLGYLYQGENPNYMMDCKQKGKVIMKYNHHGDDFHIDTTSKVITKLIDRLLYDFRKKEWNLDTLAQHFQKYIIIQPPHISFARTDKNGQLLDQSPIQLEIKGPPDFSQQLGNIDIHYLQAWYNFPFHYFWQRQKYGLLLSLIPLFLVIYYSILILKKIQIEQKKFSFIEKQTILIHDLKTPLCTNRDIAKRIINNIKKWPLSKVQEKLAIICQQSGKLLEDIRKTTFHTESRWGREITNQPFNLRKALEELIIFRQEGLENADIILDFRLEAPIIHADPFHIVHITDNLISNAAKHASKHVKIVITCLQTKQYPLIISVSDDGPGIPAHIQKHIFKKKFYHKTNKYNHGLGLTYIRDIVRQYQGNFNIKSQENKGTEFIIALNPDNLRQQRKKKLSRNIYIYLFTSLLLIEIVWMGNLYTTERYAFAKHESLAIDKAAKYTSKKFLEWQDTACFRNNRKNQTVTITRGKKDTTIVLGTSSNQEYVYSHLSYDLRGPHWNLDTFANHYRSVSTNRQAIGFICKTAGGQTIGSFPSPLPDIFMPVELDLPLGYVEGHQLHVCLSFPWILPLKIYKEWLLLSLTFIILCALLTYQLSVLTRRQQAMARFQREEVQHFIRQLQSPLIDVLHSETSMLRQAKHQAGEMIPNSLSNNLDIYRHMLVNINHLLDRLTTIQTHPQILTENYGT